MENVAELDPTIVVLVGAFLPLIISVVVQPNWPDNVRALAALVLTVAVGVLVAWWEDVFDREGITVTVAAIYALSQVSRQALWKPTGTSETIEKNTTVAAINTGGGGGN